MTGPATPSTGEVRVLVVDDQDPFRRVLAAAVDATDGFVVVGAGQPGLDPTDPM